MTAPFLFDFYLVILKIMFTFVRLYEVTKKINNNV